MRSRAAWRRRLTILAFLSPWLAGFAIFFGYPLVMTAYLSFTSYDLLTPPRWIGLDNYRYLLSEDADVWPAAATPCGSSPSVSPCRCCLRSVSRPC